MRTIIIESIKPNETEMTVEVSKDNKTLLRLIKEGLILRELIKHEVAEFLTDEAVQVRVSFLGEGTWINHSGGNA